MWLSKILELDNIREYLNKFLKESPSIEQLCLYIATSTLHNKLPKLFATADEEKSQDSKYEWQQKLKTFSYRQQQRIEQKIEESIENLRIIAKNNSSTIVNINKKIVVSCKGALLR